AAPPQGPLPRRCGHLRLGGAARRPNRGAGRGPGPRWFRGVDTQTEMKTKSLLSVPLKSRGRILGVVDAVNKRHRPFDAEDVRLLEAFGNPLAIAIENARLIQALHAARERLQEENLCLREELGQGQRFA